MNGSVTVPSSVYLNGQWATAHWMAEVVDSETGELVITATVASNGQAAPVVTALRMTSGLARELRSLAGFDARQEYDCRTTDQHIADLWAEVDWVKRMCQDIIRQIDGVEGRRIHDQDALAGQYAGLSQQVGLLQAEHVTPADVQRNREWLTGLTMRVGALEEQVPNAFKRINEQERLSEAIMKDCVDIEDRLSALDGRTGPEAGL